MQLENSSFLSVLTFYKSETYKKDREKQWKHFKILLWSHVKIFNDSSDQFHQLNKVVLYNYFATVLFPGKISKMVDKIEPQ